MRPSRLHPNTIYFKLTPDHFVGHLLDLVLLKTIEIHNGTRRPTTIDNPEEPRTLRCNKGPDLKIPFKAPATNKW
jgi:hypothetical protein